jgi:pimeloyl-ACP methyl ester carboxylesterase
MGDLLRLRGVDSSDTRYTRSSDVYVAYRVFGEGPFDLVFAMGMDFPSLEFHDHAAGSDFNELTDRMRVIRFDKRGTGASDRVSGVPSLEERMDDVRTVMDASALSAPRSWGTWTARRWRSSSPLPIPTLSFASSRSEAISVQVPRPGAGS